MICFYFLVLLLILVVMFAIIFAIFLSKISPEKYSKFCAKKVRNLARKKSLLYLDDVNLVNFDKEHIYVDQIIFGKKYIYLVTDIKLNGFVSGDACDNSWIYYNRKEKKHKYIANLNELAKDNIKEVSTLLGVDSAPFVSICLISNNCDFKIKNQNRNESHIVHFLSLKRKIRHLEKSKINSLDEEQIYEEYKRVKETNVQERN